MCTAEVRALNERTKRKVLVVGPTGRVMWSEVFEHNPRILKRPEIGCARLVNGGGVRQYVQEKTPTRWIYKKWNIAPGEMYFTYSELAWANRYSGRILVEPNTKVPDGNKAWRWNRWQELVDEVPGKFIQTGPANARRLKHVEFVPTLFRQAAAILSVSRAFVGAEGAMHHCAAAVKTPAVVLFSEFSGIEFTGYAGHRNLRHAGPYCGSRIPCAGCRAAMDAISVEEVALNLVEVLREKTPMGGGDLPLGP